MDIEVEEQMQDTGTSSEPEQIIPWKIVLRQILVFSGVCTNFFIFGLCLGTPTIYISQMRREANSTDAISNEMTSWIGSLHVYSSVPNSLFLGWLATYIGRKKTFLFASLTSIVGFLVLFFSRSLVEVLISEVIHGTLVANDCIVCVMILTEYTTPRYRGSFLLFKSASFTWGIVVANIMGTFLHWKSIAVLGFVCSTFSFSTALFWPESPYWLASKKKFIECTKSHYWLKGKSLDSKKELESLKKAYQGPMQTIQETETKVKGLGFVKSLSSKVLYKSLGYAVLIVCLYQFSGKIACHVYAIQLINDVTKNETTAYRGMLIIDGVTVFSMYLNSVIVRFFKRRTLLLTFTLSGILFLLFLSLYLYLVKLKEVKENSSVFFVLFSLYTVAVSCGPISLTPSLTAELCPLKCRGSYTIIITTFGNLLMATVIKTVPLFLKSFGPHGSFLFYGLSSMFLITLIYYLIPETKDKTIVEMDKLLRQ